MLVFKRPSQYVRRYKVELSTTSVIFDTEQPLLPLNPCGANVCAIYLKPHWLQPSCIWHKEPSQVNMWLVASIVSYHNFSQTNVKGIITFSVCTPIFSANSCYLKRQSGQRNSFSGQPNFRTILMLEATKECGYMLWHRESVTLMYNFCKWGKHCIKLRTTSRQSLASHKARTLTLRTTADMLTMVDPWVLRIELTHNAWLISKKGLVWIPREAESEDANDTCMYLKNRGPELKHGKAFKEITQNSQSWCRDYRDVHIPSKIQ